MAGGGALAGPGELHVRPVPAPAGPRAFAAGAGGTVPHGELARAQGQDGQADPGEPQDGTQMTGRGPHAATTPAGVRARNARPSHSA